MHLDSELVVLRLLLPVLELLEDEVEHPWNYTNLLEGKSNSASCSHSMRLSTACLAIGKDRRIVPLEAPEDEVSGASLEYLVLL